MSFGKSSIKMVSIEFMQLLKLQEMMVSTLDWMFELLFLSSPSDKVTLLMYFQIQILGVEIIKLLNITRNSIGLSFVPWGTPALIGSQILITSFIRKCVAARGEKQQSDGRI